MGGDCQEPRASPRLHPASKSPLNAGQDVSRNEHQIAHEKDHEPAVHMRKVDMSVVNDHSDSRDDDRDDEGDDLGC